MLITKHETAGRFNAVCSTNFIRSQTWSNPAQHSSTCQGERRSYWTQQTHPAKRSSWGQNLLYENLMTASQRETDGKNKTSTSNTKYISRILFSENQVQFELEFKGTWREDFIYTITLKDGMKRFSWELLYRLPVDIMVCCREESDWNFSTGIAVLTLRYVD